MVGAGVNSQTISVSVIIPCYNCGDTIERALGSVIAQTVRPTEVILVNDASSDETLNELCQLQAHYGRDWIKVVPLNEHSGPSVARNIGWEYATQEYIAFLDADDAWHPQKLGIQYGWMVNHPNVALSGHLCLWLKDAARRPPLPIACEAWQVKKWSLLLSNRFLTPSVMLKRVMEFRFSPDEKYSEDYLLWNQIVLSGREAYHLEMPLAYSYKAPYGAGGLSGQLWKMESGELDTYRRLRNEQLISWPAFVGLSVFSIVKCIRRLVISQLVSPENRRKHA